MLFKETWVLLCRADWLSTVGHFWRRNVSSRCSFGTRFVCGTSWARFFNNWAHFKKTFGAFSALNDPGHTDQIGFPCLVETNFSLIPAAGRRNSKKKSNEVSRTKEKKVLWKKKIQKLYFSFEFRKCHFQNRFVIFFVLSFRFFFLETKMGKMRWMRCHFNFSVDTEIVRMY